MVRVERWEESGGLRGLASVGFPKVQCGLTMLGTGARCCEGTMEGADWVL